MKIRRVVMLALAFFSAAMLLSAAEPVLALTEQVISPYCTFVGSGAGTSNSAYGFNNSFIGYRSGHNNVDGSSNTFVGYQTGYTNQIGSYNTYMGHNAGHDNTQGRYNTFIGHIAGYKNNNYSGGNTFIGAAAGYVNITGHHNVFIGDEAGYYEEGSNKLYISNSNTSAPLIYGEFDNKLVEINGKLVFASDERLKKNIEPLNSSLDRVLRLKGVSYEWKAEKDQGKGRNIGLLAQDVERIFPEVVHTNSKGFKALEYDKLVPALVEAIKEQQQLVVDQKKTITEQQAAISALTDRLATLEKIAEGLGGLESNNLDALK